MIGNMMKFSPDRVWLAPMSGATDAPFRRQVVGFGARAVVSEMVAGESLVLGRPDVVRRTCRHEGGGPWIVQLAARRPEDMKAGAALLRQAGVDVIDINMGCPSRQVTGGQSGSALMREPDLAAHIVDAAIEGAQGRPVTLKMRLGWCDESLNAPVIARRAEAQGIRMITVHGRTRCQFYKGQADWNRVGDTVASVNIPVIVNGDIFDETSARKALELSGAHGVMIGRAAIGRPWLVAQIAHALDGKSYREPNHEEVYQSLVDQVRDSVNLYGSKLGIRIIRKHISATVELSGLSDREMSNRDLRRYLCQIDDEDELIGELSNMSKKTEAIAS